MSKQVLKIERQPWMPKGAQYWCFNVNQGSLYYNDYYMFEDGMIHQTIGDVWVTPSYQLNLEEMLEHYNYVYEVVDSVKTD